MSLETNQKPGTVKLVQDRMIVSDNTGDGIVRVYKRIQRQYGVVQELEPSDEGLGLKYGTSLYANGNFLIVHEITPESGGYLAGKLYTYEWTGNKYVLRNEIKKTRTTVSEVTFGEEYIVESGKVIASVTYENGTKEFYSFPFVDPGEEVAPPLLYGPLISFDQSEFNMTNIELEVSPAVAISADASTIVMARCFESDGNPETPEYSKVYIYVKDDDEYIEEKVYTNVNGFGATIDISEFANEIIIGSPNESNFLNSTLTPNSGKLYIAEKVNGIWGSLQTLEHPGVVTNGLFPQASCISGNGRVIYAFLPEVNEVVRYNKDINDVWSLSTQRVQAEPVDLDIANKISMSTMYDGSRFTLGPKIYSYAETVVVNELQKITKNTTGLGFSVDSDGDRVIVGAYNEQTQTGSVYVYQYTNGTYTEIRQFTNPVLGFGYSVAIKGTNILIGAPFADGYKIRPDVTWSPGIGLTSNLESVTESGLVYYNDLTSGSGTLNPFGASDLRTGDRFGHSVSFGHNNKFLVSAPFHGATTPFGPGYGTGKVYFYNGFNQFEYSRLSASDAASYSFFGWDVALNNEASTIAVIGSIEKEVNSVMTGQAYVFEATNGTSFSEIAKISPPDLVHADEFGHTVSIDGTRIAVGAPGQYEGSTTPGKVYVFDKVNSVYSQIAKLIPSDSQTGGAFGFSLHLTSDKLLIGSPYKTSNGMVTGRAYIYNLVNNTYVQSNILNASNAGEENSVGDADNFGFNVRLNNNNILVADPREDQISDSSGAVYNLAISSTNLVTDLTTLGTETILDLNPNIITSGGSNLVSLFQPFERIVKVDGDYVVTIDQDFGPTSTNLRVYENDNGTYSNVFTRSFSDGVTAVDMRNERIVVGCGYEDTHPTTGINAGNVYVFHKDAATFTEIDSIAGSVTGGFASGSGGSSSITQAGKGYYIAGSTAKQGDLFGAYVSIYGDKIVIGSTEDIPIDLNNTYDYINEVWLGDFYGRAGKIYVYGFDGSNWVSQSTPAVTPLITYINNSASPANSWMAVKGVKLIDESTIKVLVEPGYPSFPVYIDGILYDEGVYTTNNTGTPYSFDTDFSYLNEDTEIDLYNDGVDKIDVSLLINGEYSTILTEEVPSLIESNYFVDKVGNELVFGTLTGASTITYETYDLNLDGILTKASKGGNTSGVFMSSDGNIVTTALLRNDGTNQTFDVYIFNYNNSTSSYVLSGLLPHTTQNLDSPGNYQLTADGSKIFTVVGQDNLSHTLYQYEYSNNNWIQTLLYNQPEVMSHSGVLGLDASNDGTIIVGTPSDTDETYIPFGVTVFKDLTEEPEADPDAAPLVDFGMQIYGTTEYPYTQKLISNSNRLFINTYEYIPGTIGSHGKIYVLFWNGSEYITLQEIAPVIPEGKTIIFAKNYEVKGTKLIVTSLLISDDSNVDPVQFVSVYEFIVGQYVLNKNFYTPNLVNEDFGFDLAMDEDRLIIGANDEFADPDVNNIYIHKQIDVSESGSEEEFEGGEYTQVRIHLGLPYENVFEENGINTSNLPDITTPNFIGDGRTLYVDYATENVVNVTLTTQMTIYDIKLGDKIVGRMRVFNKTEPYIELILYVIGFGYDEGITEALLRDGLKLSVKYPSPNIKFALNTMPRLHSVNFV